MVLFVSLAGSNSSLHKLLHSDCDSPDHQCVVTLFSHGQVTPPSTTVIVVAALVLYGATRLLTVTVEFASVKYSFCKGRAPPV